MVVFLQRSGRKNQRFPGSNRHFLKGVEGIGPPGPRPLVPLAVSASPTMILGPQAVPRPAAPTARAGREEGRGLAPDGLPLARPGPGLPGEPRPRRLRLLQAGGLGLLLRPDGDPRLHPGTPAPAPRRACRGDVRDRGPPDHVHDARVRRAQEVPRSLEDRHDEDLARDPHLLRARGARSRDAPHGDEVQRRRFDRLLVDGSRRPVGVHRTLPLRANPEVAPRIRNLARRARRPRDRTEGPARGRGPPDGAPAPDRGPRAGLEERGLPSRRFQAQAQPRSAPRRARGRRHRAVEARRGGQPDPRTRDPPPAHRDARHVQEALSPLARLPQAVRLRDARDRRRARRGRLYFGYAGRW